MQQRHRNAVAERHVGLLDRTPRLVRPHAAGNRAGKAEARRLTKSRLGKHFPHFLRRHCQRHLRHADVGRLLDDGGDVDHAMRVGVADRMVAYHETPAGGGVEQGVRSDALGVERQRHRERLESRAGLERVGDDAVAQLLAGQLAAVVRIVAGPVGQRQHFTGVDVEHHRRAGLGVEFLHRVLDAGKGDVLQLAVDRQRQVAAVVRLLRQADVLDDAAEAVLDHAAAAGGANECLLLRQFHAFLADVLDAGEAHQVGHHFALRIEALVFLARVEAVDAELVDLVDDVHFDLALEVDEGTVGVELLAQIRFRHVQQCRQCAQLGRRLRQHVVGNGPHRLDRQRRRQHLAVAVHDLAARGRQFEHALVTALALLLKKAGRHRLQPQRAAGQRGERGKQREQHHARTPVRQAYRQHRAGRKRHPFRGRHARGGHPSPARAIAPALHLAASVRY